MFQLPANVACPTRIRFTTLTGYWPVPTWFDHHALRDGDLWSCEWNMNEYWIWLPLGTQDAFIYPAVPVEYTGRKSPRRWLMAAKKKFIPPASKPKGKSLEAPDCLDIHFGDAFPMLWGYLSCKVDSDGSPREPATLALFAEGGGWKGYLHDRHEHQKLWAAAESYMGICEQLESFLGDSRAHWREDWMGKTGKRK